MALWGEISLCRPLCLVPAEIMLVSVCQLELSVSLLLQATYSHTLPLAVEITGGRREEHTGTKCGLFYS